MTSFALVDNDARIEASNDLETNFVVEAGAGTGKTSLLVNRMLTILMYGRAGLDQIVAITFTEKAAGELKIRLREEIERRRAEAMLPQEQRERLQVALEDLERAHVSTIHAFCAAVLREHPLAAGVDPAFRVLDEIAATLLRQQTWEDWLAAEMDGDAAVVNDALAAGVELWQLREAAFQWLEQRDLFDFVPAAQAVELSGFRQRIDARVDRLVLLRARCRDERDTAFRAIDELVRFRARLTALSGDEEALLLLRPLRLPGRVGNRRNWEPATALDSMRAVLRDIRDDHDEVSAALGHNRSRAVAQWLRGFVETYQSVKRARGALDFSDLLLMTRDILRCDRGLRRQLQRRFRYLLVDEFQDTDPLQAEIVFLLAESSPHSDDWRTVALATGKLFIVGDPQQCIYRFRRADLTIYDAAKSVVAGQGRVVRLQTNFRSTSPVIDWVNERFPSLLRQPEEGLEYAPLFAGPESGAAGARSVVWLPPVGLRTSTTAEDARRLEARTVAAFLRHIVAAETWTCRALHGGQRRLRFGDVAILFRRYDAMRHYQNELRDLDVPYRIVGGRRLFRRQEMIELHAVLSAVVNPNDDVAVVATLRSLFCGVSDEDLLLFRRAGGQFDYRAPVSASMPGGSRMAPAYDWLRRLHDRARAISSTRLLGELFASTHILALLYLKPQGDQLVANLLKVVDLARDLERDGIDTLAGFVRVLETVQGLEIETEEPPVSEPGDDVVRLLTIHKAKGLEFPVVILADGGLDVEATVPPLVVDRIGGDVAFRVGSAALRLETRNFHAIRPHEEKRIHAEEMRLLYVAATRARDYLVLPHHVNGRQGSFLGALATGGGYTFDSARLDTGPRALRPFRLTIHDLDAGPSPVREPSLWEATVAARQAEPATRVRSVSQIRAASSVETPRFGRGTGGGATLGTVVHQALRRADLNDPNAAERIVASLASAAGLPHEQRGLAVELVSRALASPTVRRAAAAEACYREMPFTMRRNEILVEGIVDLAFVDDDALVIVDFKTDQMDAPVPSAAQVAAYRPQAVLYAYGLECTTGMPVREVWLSFLRNGAEARVRGDWEAEADVLMAAAT